VTNIGLIALFIVSYYVLNQVPLTDGLFGVAWGLDGSFKLISVPCSAARHTCTHGVAVY